MSPIPGSDGSDLNPSQQPPAPAESSRNGLRRRIFGPRSASASNKSRPPPPIGLKLFPFEELKSATNEFSESNFVGEGGFGRVYRGFLRDYGEVAIKKEKGNDNFRGAVGFHTEALITSRVHHRHIVSLVGYYIYHKVKTHPEKPPMLVYEFLPNKSLQFHLHDDHPGRDANTIDWETRMKIAVGSAKGLTYLHEGCEPKIIHCDIKPSNLLLDKNFQPKIAGFGTARLLSDSDTNISMSRVMETGGLAVLSPDYDDYDATPMLGNLGYLAPECLASERFSEKSDVYAFGVVLFELITGQKPWYDHPGGRGLEWARPLFSVALQNGEFEELADARLGNEYNAEEMFRMVSCAANCLRFSAAHRPRMSQVVQALEGASRLENDLTNAYNKEE